LQPGGIGGIGFEAGQSAGTPGGRVVVVAAGAVVVVAAAVVVGAFVVVGAAVVAMVVAVVGADVVAGVALGAVVALGDGDGAAVVAGSPIGVVGHLVVGTVVGVAGSVVSLGSTAPDAPAGAVVATVYRPDPRGLLVPGWSAGAAAGSTGAPASPGTVVALGTTTWSVMVCTRVTTCGADAAAWRDWPPNPRIDVPVIAANEIVPATSVDVTAPAVARATRRSISPSRMRRSSGVPQDSPRLIHGVGDGRRCRRWISSEIGRTRPLLERS
jgi:hypothetical protein